MRSRTGDEGSATVEFALLLPILLLVLLALVQVGVIARDQLVLTQAARAGARAAAVQPDEADVRAATLAAAPGLDPARLGIDVLRTGTRGTPVTVAVRYDVDVAGPLAGWLLPAALTLHSSATMRQEFA